MQLPWQAAASIAVFVLAALPLLDADAGGAAQSAAPAELAANSQRSSITINFSLVELTWRISAQRRHRPPTWQSFGRFWRKQRVRACAPRSTPPSATG